MSTLQHRVYEIVKAIYFFSLVHEFTKQAL